MWKTVFITVILSRALRAVKVTTITPIVSDDSTPELMLPCEYVLNNRTDQPVIFSWEKNGEFVLVRDLLGKDFSAKEFQNKYTFGHGCSLVLCQPTEHDSGNYTVKVTALGGEVKSGIAHTAVTVTNGVTWKKIDPTTLRQFITTKQQQECPKIQDPQGIVKTAVVVCSLWAAVFFLVLVDQIVLIWKHVHGDDRDWRIPLPGKIISVLLLISGEIVLITGIYLRNWTYTKVGSILLFLTLSISGFFGFLRRVRQRRKRCHRADREDAEGIEPRLSDSDET